MFDTVLIANRGEIAVRIAATLRDLGVRSVAVYSDADLGARHVAAADEALRIGPAAAAESYLNVAAIVAAARACGAQAIHPGYGFLSENPAFARACAAGGIVFIGPGPEAIEAMGDKIHAKQTVSAAGVPVVPGRSEPGLSDEEVAAAAREVGFPVLLKPSAGGGGKGMRTVRAEDELAPAIAAARREASGAFGDDTLLVERFVDTPRHIEVQVLADTHGNVVHLGERECSLQRRHQKIVEEAPSVLLDEATRERMGAAAVEAARSVGYVSAGTVEFIVSGRAGGGASGGAGGSVGGSAGGEASRMEFFFMEMNTRLQVEHPVTEMVYGTDLVAQQVRIAAGEEIQMPPPTPRGHAVEVRVYAESVRPDGFLPSGGTVLALREPTDLARVDSGLSEGETVGSDYDPMLAKIVSHGRDRAEALRSLDAALGRTVILGLATNLGFLARLLALPAVRAGNLDTGLVERELHELAAPTPAMPAVLAAAMLRLLRMETGADGDPWAIPGGWRLGEPAPMRWQVIPAGGEPQAVTVTGRAHSATVAVDGGEPVAASAELSGRELVVRTGAGIRRYITAGEEGSLWLAGGAETWHFSEIDPVRSADEAGPAVAGGRVTSPMPGTVLAVLVTEGEQVRAGSPLVIVEAMKMEHTLTASIDGAVSEVYAKQGQAVALDELLAVVVPHEPCEHLSSL
jgi:acetyl-CoA/propionyl-CoA carboxylase biotin carboxyl carrier protein